MITSLSIVQKGCLIGILIMLGSTGFAQTQETPEANLQAEGASVVEQILEEDNMRWGAPYSPRRAALLSAALPGLGQVYNGKAWKVGLIYAGFATTGYLAYTYQQFYEENLRYLYNEIDEDPTTINPIPVQIGSLRLVVDNSRRARDYAYLASGIVYLLTIAEAHIDAHLNDFDLDDDLLAHQRKVEIHPLVVSQPNYTGVGIRITLP